MFGVENTATCIDVTFITVKKHQRSGFLGRMSEGHQTAIVGFFEVDLTTGCGTGQCHLEVLPGATEKREFIEPLIRKYVRRGGLIWTDGHSSYKWIGAGALRGQLSPEAGYYWDWCNHKAGEFSHGEDLVSTNSAEGLFGRTKRFFRKCNLTKVAHADYAPYLAEFLWRERFLVLSDRLHGGNMSCGSSQT